MPRPKGSADLLSDRRRRALTLLKSGLSLNEVARRIQCAASSVNALVECLATKRCRRPEGPFLARTSAEAYARTTASFAETVAERTTGARLQHQRVDHRAYRGTDPERVCGELPSGSHRALDAPSELESSKAGVARVERNEPAMERWKRQDWPRVKKKLRGWVPTSSLPTNPDSC